MLIDINDPEILDLIDVFGIPQFEEYFCSPNSIGFLLAEADDVTERGGERGPEVQGRVAGGGIKTAQQDANLENPGKKI